LLALAVAAHVADLELELAGSTPIQVSSRRPTACGDRGRAVLGEGGAREWTS
jgi:hypothetical protein